MGAAGREVNDPNTLALGSALLALLIVAHGIRGLFRKRRKWGGWYRDVYLKSSHWRETSRRIRERDGYTCQDCGGAGSHVHHLTYSRLWHERDGDLVTLCPECHGKRHG